MKRTIYLIGNSQTMRKNIDYEKVYEAVQVKNEKVILSIIGEERAKDLANLACLKDVTKIYSSHYVRAIGTAKYLAVKNELDIIVNENLGERKIGILGNLDGMDFHQRQIKDFNYKLNGGESLNQVKLRTINFLNEILKETKDEVIAIFSHQTALTCLLANWCEVGYSLDNKLVLSYKDEVIADENWEYPTVFEIKLNDLDVENIKKVN